jgi:hypothetical protein
MDTTDRIVVACLIGLVLLLILTQHRWTTTLEEQVKTLQRRVYDLESARPMPPVEELPFAEDCPAGEVK